MSLLPLAAVFFVRRLITEPDRFTLAAAERIPRPVLGAVGPRFRRRLVVVAGLAFAVSLITGPANSFVFLYADNVLHQPGYLTALMVAGAGLSGLAGLTVGRWLADHAGRRPTAAAGMLGIGLFGVVAYSGSAGALTAGYTLGVMTGSVLAPAAGAMVNELFPTSVRASAAGWWMGAGVLGAATGLVAFGAVADLGGQFRLAGVVTFVPAAAAAGLLWLLPETRGRELEQVDAEGD